MIYQLEKHIADLLKDFFKNYEFIDKVVVFGSRAKHNANPKSDIDLCVYSSKMSDKEFSKLRLEIDDLPILQKLDVVHFEKVNAELQNNVEKDGKLLYKKVKKVKLQDYIHIQNGYAFKSNLFQNFGIPIVRITNVENGKLNLDKVVYYSEDKKLDKFIIKKDDILLSLTGDDKTLKVCMNDSDEKIYLNQRVAILRSNESLIQKYLYYAIKKYSSLILEKAKGIAQKNISVDDINSLEVPLPSMEKQKQIAKTLDKANELIELRKESITKLDALAKSIFIDMFGDPIGNPKDWEIKKIIDLGKVQTGNTPPRVESDNYGDFIEWIKSDNILKDKMIITEAREYLSEKGYRKGRIADKGSLLFTCIAGSMSSIGNLAMTDRQVTFNQQINSLTPVDNNELYLYSLFKLCKKFFEENSTKSMKIMINKSTFENLLFPIAPIDLQNKFARIIEKIEEQKSLYEKELEKLQVNFDALLQKSFQE